MELDNTAKLMTDDISFEDIDRRLNTLTEDVTDRSYKLEIQLLSRAKLLVLFLASAYFQKLS